MTINDLKIIISDVENLVSEDLLDRSNKQEIMFKDKAKPISELLKSVIFKDFVINASTDELVDIINFHLNITTFTSEIVEISIIDKSLELMFMKYGQYFTNAFNKIQNERIREEDARIRIIESVNKKQQRKMKLISIESGNSVEVLTAIYPLCVFVPENFKEIIEKSLQTPHFLEMWSPHMSRCLKKVKSFNDKDIFNLALHGKFVIGSKVDINKETPEDGTYELLDFFEILEGGDKVQISTNYSNNSITLKDGIIVDIKPTLSIFEYPIGVETKIQ